MIIPHTVFSRNKTYPVNVFLQSLDIMSLCLYSASATYLFKNASAFLLRGARHAIAWHTSTAHLCKSTLRFGRRKTIVHRTMCALPEAISAGGLTPTTDTSLFLTTYRGGSHLPTDIWFSIPYFLSNNISRSYLYFSSMFPLIYHIFQSSFSHSFLVLSS